MTVAVMVPAAGSAIAAELPRPAARGTVVGEGQARASGSSQTLTIELESSANPSVEGDPITLTATASAPDATGSVEFVDTTDEPETFLGTADLVSGVATLGGVQLPAGTHDLEASYGGDATYGPATDTLVQVVKQLLTIALESSDNPSVEGDPITLTATASEADATGSVQFVDTTPAPDTLLGTADLVSGVATLADVQLAVGTHDLEARYGGDATYGPATGTLTQVVNVPPLGAPNIIVIMLDDVPYLDGRLFSVLPNINELFVDEGTTYRQFHSETPQCCPARAGFLTGQHTHHHNVRKNDARRFVPSMTLATAMDDVGYRTFLSGKYLNNYKALAPAVPPGWDHFHGMETGYYGYSMWSDGKPGIWHGRDEEDYSTDVIANRAVKEIMRAPPNRPVFGWIAPSAAHLPRTPAPRHQHDPRCKAVEPWSPPNYMEEDVSDKPGYIQRRDDDGSSGFPLVRICRVLLSVDDLVGDVRDALAATGRLKDTLLILTGDNGMTYGAHRMLNDKKTPYSTQVPFLVSWPDRLGRSPRTVSARLMNIDLAPTLCEIAGCTLGPYPNGQRSPDGLSFADALLDEGPAPDRGEVLLSYLAPKTSVPRWWGMATTRDSEFATVGCAEASEGRCLWLYVRYRTGERELYDLSNGPCWTWRPKDSGDPCMLQNRAGDPAFADLQAVLHARLEVLRKDPPATRSW